MWKFEISIDKFADCYNLPRNCWSRVLRPQLRGPFAPPRQACWPELEMRRRNVWKWRSFFPFLPLLFHGGRQLQRTLGGAAEGDKADWNETHSFKRYPSRKRVAILQRRSRMDPGHSEFLSINADPEGSLQVCRLRAEVKVISDGNLVFTVANGFCRRTLRVYVRFPRCNFVRFLNSEYLRLRGARNQSSGSIQMLSAWNSPNAVVFQTRHVNIHIRPCCFTGKRCPFEEVIL